MLVVNAADELPLVVTVEVGARDGVVEGLLDVVGTVGDVEVEICVTVVDVNAIVVVLSFVVIVDGSFDVETVAALVAVDDCAPVVFVV